MSLSNIVQYPTKKIKLPESGFFLRIRPFTGKESKVMKLALEGEDKAAISSTVRDCIHACITEKQFDVTSFSSIDIEVLFLELIKISTGHLVNTGWTCNMDYTDEETGQTSKCNTHIEVEHNLNDIVWPTDFDKREYLDFQITDNVTARFTKHKSTKMFDHFASSFTEEKPIEQLDDQILSDCLDKVFLGEEVIEGSEHTHQERVEFIESIPVNILKEIEEFVVNQHEASLTTEFTCPKCKYEHSMTTRGIEGFFI